MIFSLLINMIFKHWTCNVIQWTQYTETIYISKSWNMYHHSSNPQDITNLVFSDRQWQMDMTNHFTPSACMWRKVCEHMLRVYIWLVSIVSKLLNVSKQWTVLDNAYIKHKRVRNGENKTALVSTRHTYSFFFKDCHVNPVYSHCLIQ